ncbi:MAG: hypothetical protein JNL62_26420, partial [Bryobacterales bacterium]|nr:hypothetical protein [Bryobacterales bacterium]
MNQHIAIIGHIIRKDLTGLRWQALLVLALQLSYAALHFRPLPAGPGTAEVVLAFLLIAVHLFFISCAVHADAIPGDRQYWLTRPFTRTQLLSAKLILTLAVIHIPLLLSDCIILAGHQFNPLHSLGGLLWRQVLYFVAATMITLALAAVTRNLSQFALSAIVLGVCVVFLPSLLPQITFHWGGLLWIKVLLNSLLASTGAIAVLYLLYLRRRVQAGWAVLATTALVFPFASDLAPFAFAFHVQRQIHSKPSFEPAVRFDSARVRPDIDRKVNPKNLTLLLPISVHNIPGPTGAHADYITATLRLPGGEAHQLKLRGSWSADRGSSGEWIFFPFDSDLFAKFQDQTVTIDVNLYMTSFGRPRTRVLPAQSPEPRHMGELGRCASSIDPANIVVVSCLAPIKLPTR